MQGQTKQWRSHITPLIEVKILEFTSMGLCGCNLKEKLEPSKGTYKETTWHQIGTLAEATTDKTDKRFLELLKWRSEEVFFVQKELGGLHCEWDAYHQALDSIDEWNTYQRHEFEKTFRCCYHLLLEGDLTSNFNVSSLLPIKTSRYSYVCVLKFRSV